MNSHTHPHLESLDRLISAKETELATLRKEREMRAALLQDLARERQQIQTKLQEVEGKIKTLHVQPVAAPKPRAPAPASKPAPAPKPAPAAPAEATTLAGIVLAALARAKAPLTLKQLTEHVRSVGYPSKSKDLESVVKPQVYRLEKRGEIARAKDGGGFVKAPAGKPAAAKAPAPKPAPAKASAAVVEQPPLRELILKTLGRHRKPVTGPDLAREILASGYKSESQNFENMVYKAIARMGDVERAPEGGYRLARR